MGRPLHDASPLRALPLAEGGCDSGALHDPALLPAARGALERRGSAPAGLHVAAGLLLSPAAARQGHMGVR